MKVSFGSIFSYTQLFLSPLVQKTSGEHVLPEFTGLWYWDERTNSPVYGDTPDYQGNDACSIPFYTYGTVASSPEALMRTIPRYSGCEWDYYSISFVTNYTDMPFGFISQNSDDWNNILLDPEAPLTKGYEMTGMCYVDDVDDNDDSTYIYARVAPFYDCPSNTRLSYDNVTKERGCTTTPVPCLADIVARDLNVTGAGWLGHTGLISTYGVESTPQVLEVLYDEDKNISGIFIDPLYGEDSFSVATNYWGERYGLTDHTRLSLDVATKIIETGTNQAQYQFTYTALWDYYAGGTTEHPDECKFRCDSFVYYSYDVGGSLKIVPDFWYPETPRTIFYDFLCGADPIQSCSTFPMLPSEQDNFDLHKLEQTPDIESKTTTMALEIFNVLRPVLLTKTAQREQLPRLISQYQQGRNVSLESLFVRCLCFELKDRDPAQIDNDVKPLISELLQKYKDFISDNFPLAIAEGNLSFYVENPPCKWLNAIFTVNAETQSDKETGMIDYIDQQTDVVEQADLVSSSRLSSLQTLSPEKRCEYGRFFQTAYHHDKTLSDKKRQILWLGMAEMKYPVDEAIPPHAACRSNAP